MRKFVLAAVLLAGCSTVGVFRQDQPWAIVEPTIAAEMILDNKTIVVFDLRSIEEFYGEIGHVAGAVSVPVNEIDRRLQEILPYRSETVLIYADVPGDAEDGAAILAAAGFRNIVVINGGIRRWIDLGYKTVRSHRRLGSSD